MALVLFHLVKGCMCQVLRQPTVSRSLPRPHQHRIRHARLRGLNTCSCGFTTNTRTCTPHMTINSCRSYFLQGPDEPHHPLRNQQHACWYQHTVSTVHAAEHRWCQANMQAPHTHTHTSCTRSRKAFHNKQNTEPSPTPLPAQLCTTRQPQALLQAFSYHS